MSNGITVWYTAWAILCGLSPPKRWRQICACQLQTHTRAQGF